MHIYLFYEYSSLISINFWMKTGAGVFFFDKFERAEQTFGRCKVQGMVESFLAKCFYFYFGLIVHSNAGLDGQDRSTVDRLVHFTLSFKKSTLINSISYLSKYLYQIPYKSTLINYFYILEYSISSSMLFSFII